MDSGRKDRGAGRCRRDETPICQLAGAAAAAEPLPDLLEFEFCRNFDQTAHGSTSTETQQTHTRQLPRTIDNRLPFTGRAAPAMSNQHELDSASLRAVAGLFPMIMAFDSNADEGSEFVRVLSGV